MKKIITLLFALLLFVGLSATNNIKAEDNNPSNEYKVYYKLEFDSQGIYTLYISGTNMGGYTEDPKNGVYNSKEELPWYEHLDEIGSVFISAVRPSQTSYWFAGLSNATNINLNNLNTQDVQNMSYMFLDCHSLTYLEIASSTITSSVTNMTKMFSGCTNLETIKVSSNFSTASVTSSDNMFEGCTSLVGGNGTQFDAGKTDVTYARYDQPENNPGYFTQYYKLKFDAGDGSTVSPVCKDVDGGEAVGSLPVPTRSDYSFVSWVDEEGEVVDESKTMPNNDTTIYAKWVSIYWGVSNGELHLSGSKSETAKNLTNGIYDETNKAPWASSANEITKVIIENEIVPVETAYWFSDLVKVSEFTDLNKLDTSEVTDMTKMFYNCSSLETFNNLSLKTSKVTKMTGMFGSCSALESIELSSLDTSSVTDMASMFEGCTGLSSLNITNFKTITVTNFNRMFGSCSNLETIYTSENYFKIYYSAVGYDMFIGCNKLEGENGTKYDENNVGLNYAKIDKSGEPGYFSSLNFYWGLEASKTYGRYVLHLSNSPFTETMFKEGVSEGIYNSQTVLPWYSYLTSIAEVKIDSELTLNQTAYLFSGLSEVESIDLSNLNNYKNSDMSHMFEGCSALKEIDLSDMSSTKLKDTSAMFKDCTSLTNVVIGDFNVDEVTTMSRMFENCGSLTSLNLSTFNTGKVTDVSWMFYNCAALTDLDIKNFVTDKVTTMESMFEGCASLTYLDICGFSTAKTNRMTSMFKDCKKLKTIHASADFDGRTVNDNAYVFTGCTSLVGGNGTKFDSKYDDGYYAHFDDPGTKPGYLTQYVKLNFDANYDGGSVRQLCMDIEPGTIVGTLTSPIDRSNYSFVGWFDEKVGGNRIDEYTVMGEYEYTAYAHWSTIYWGINDSNVLYLSSNPLSGTYRKSGNTDGEFYDTKSPDWYDSSVVKIVIKDKITPANTMYWFADMSKVKSIEGLNNLDTSNNNCMDYMFYNCSALTSLDLTSFDVSNVVEMAYTFAGCTSLKNLNVSNFEATNVVSTSYMFSNCKALASLDLSNFKAINVVNLEGMFMGCESLKQLDLTGFDTSIVILMRDMFNGCKNLKSIDLSSFDTHYVVDMNNMFKNCEALESLDLLNFYTGNVTNMTSMFEGCKSLTSLDLSKFITSKVTKTSAMFKNCTNLKTIYATESYFDVTKVKESVEMFTGCTAIVGDKGTTYDANKTNIDYARIDYGTLGEGYFSQKKLYWYVDSDWTLHLSNSALSKDYEACVDIFNSVSETPWSTSGAYENIKKVVIENELRLTSVSCLFGCLRKVTEIENLNYLDTSLSYSLSEMFYDCDSLKSVDLSGFDTSRVTDMSDMFFSCESLTSVDFSGFDTTKVTNMSELFKDCISLKEVKLKDFDTSNVIDMEEMFYNCQVLETLDLSNFDTANVTNMGWMFLNCLKLKTITASYLFDTSNVTTSYSMFSGCNELKGGQGTIVGSHLDKTYARIDKGSSAPGYFTLVKTEEIEASRTLLHMMPSGETEVTLSFVPEYASKEVKLSGYDTSIVEATVDEDGIVTIKANKTGKVTITVTAQDDSKNPVSIKLYVEVAGTADNPVIYDKENYTQGSKIDLHFKSNDELSNFLKNPNDSLNTNPFDDCYVKIDNKQLTYGTDYIASEGSIVVTVYNKAIKNLSAGKHTITIKSKMGTATNTFTVYGKDEPYVPVDTGSN